MVLLPAPAGPSIAIVRGVIVALVAERRAVPRPESIVATAAAAPRVLPRLLVRDAPRVLPRLVVRDALRVLPRLGVLARELASPPATPALPSTAGGAPPLSLARIPLAASPAARSPARCPSSQRAARFRSPPVPPAASASPSAPPWRRPPFS